MSWLRRVMVDRHGHNWVLLGRFVLVGATGVVVNLVTLRLVEQLGPSYTRILIDLPATDYNVRWYHLYNDDDGAFTHEIRLNTPGFLQVETTFDKPWDPMNHAPDWYLRHENAVASMWRALLSGEHSSLAAARAVAGGRAIRSGSVSQATTPSITTYGG